MSIVLDEYKGFCYDNNAKVQRHSTIVTTGIDRLPLYEELTDLPKKLVPQVPESKKKSKQEKREEKRNKKLEKVLQKKAQESNSLQLDSPIKVRNEIKQIYTKLYTKEDTKLFQYESVALYSSDLPQILPEEWINDNIISLVYEVLNEKYLQLHKKFVKLISPAVVQLMVYTDHEILEKKDFERLKLIFLPVNETEDGDHWFLVVVNLLENCLLVYDSMVDEEDNRALLANIANKLFKAGILTSSRVDIRQMKIEQQSNFDDCGVYVIMISCFLVNMLLYEPINFDLSPIKYDPLKGRLDILRIIDMLNDEINSSDD